MATKISAFLDGNTIVHYNDFTGKLIGGNSGGLIKVFDPETDSEPTSIDIPEDITAVSSHGERLLVTSSSGELALVSLGSGLTDYTYETLWKADFPLRDVVYINDGSRSVCIGDSPKLMIFDHAQNNSMKEVSLPVVPVSLSYGTLGEVIAVSLSNGNVQVFSVINEDPTHVKTIEGILAAKSNTSKGPADYSGEHSHELVCTKCLWAANGEVLLVPTANGSLQSFLRSDWTSQPEFSSQGKRLVSVAISPNSSIVASLYEDGAIDFFDIRSASKLSSLTTDISGLCINIAWTNKSVYFGSTSGELYVHKVAFADAEPVTSHDVELLFVDQADESDQEPMRPVPASKKHSLDDSHIIDEDDDDDDDDLNGYDDKLYNKSVEDILVSRKKKAKHVKFPSMVPPTTIAEKIVPYSPGSTPWIQSNISSNSTKRRYLFMSSIGYAWSIGSQDDQKSITVSFFDRSVNKDYHFVDTNNFDLCSMNEKGVLFGCSGDVKSDSLLKGKVSYRHHQSTSDSWERQIPLVDGEYITSISLTSTAVESGESLIVVGTNLGYLRFFNLYGLCINLMKTLPVAASIASLLDTIFIVHQSGFNTYSYSIINVSEDYTFVQQERPLSLKSNDGPLIKGLFFNEYSDPCIVAGHDDTLTILSHWRETNNARWVPILNCRDVVTDYGVTKSKQKWRSWPLGFHEQKFVAMVLKTNDSYPGFPLPLPVDFPIRLPVRCHRALVEEAAENIDEEIEEKLAKIQEDDPEEEFLRASTFGKLLSASMADLEDEEELLEKLNAYSVEFDKSLLKLFNNACQSSRLNKAFSIVKLIKNDKALLAATRIGERHNFNNLVAKINKLREELMEMVDEE